MNEEKDQLGSDVSRTTLVILGVTILVCLAINIMSFPSYAFFQDEIRYINIAETFLHGGQCEYTFNGRTYPYPINWQPAFGWLVGLVRFLTPDYLAAIRVSLSLCLTAAVLGVCLFLKKVFGNWTIAIFAAILLLSSQVIMRVSLGGIADLMGVACVIWCYYFVFLSIQNQKPDFRRALLYAGLAGLLGGLAIMTRGEGIIYAGLCAMGFFYLPSETKWSFKRRLCLWIPYVLFLVLICLPWVLYVHKIRGNWSFTPHDNFSHYAADPSKPLTFMRLETPLRLLQSYVKYFQRYFGSRAIMFLTTTPLEAMLAGIGIFRMTANRRRILPMMGLGLIATGIFLTNTAGSITRYYLLLTFWWSLMAGVGLWELTRLCYAILKKHKWFKGMRPSTTDFMAYIPLICIVLFQLTVCTKYVVKGTEIWPTEYKVFADWSAKHLPDNAKLLVSREAMTYYPKQESVSISSMPKDASLDEIRAWCQGKGITHAVITWRWKNSYVPTALLRKIQDKDLPDYLRLLHEDDTYPHARFTVYAFEP